MSFLEILNTILLRPLELLFEMIYVIANRVIGNPGLSIIVLSLVMNFLVLPLYIRADAMQEEEKNMEMKLRKGVAHIKKTFKGDERMMMLQTYYRQNNYKPTYVLRGAVSLFLEIPFFIAAYRFLSGLQLLNGVSFGPIADLGKPDGMLVISGITINVLPFLMTGINLISCVIFTKGSSVKQKIQLYGMALFFLVFLYTSPAGLVFYWTLNNLFSLVKTIFYKLKNPLKVVGILFSIAGILLLVGGLKFYPELTPRKMVFFIGCGLLMQSPLLYTLLKNKITIEKLKFMKQKANIKVFLSGAVFLAVLMGGLIPSAVIKSSPQEFVNINYFYHPNWFLVSSICFAVGIFVVWMGVFYWLAKPSVRVIFDKVVWIVAGIAVVDYMFFGKNLGLLNAQLKYESGLVFNLEEMLLNIGVIFVVIIAFFVFSNWSNKKVGEILVIGTLAISGMSIFNIVSINDSIKEIRMQAEHESENIPHFTLSKKGKNVIVFMLDRALGECVPYLFNEKPELREQFAGFTYYSNVISHGGFTNFGTPALFGGYEYTPVEMNKRSDMALVEKQNEALKVMPVLFNENGYDVTVCDPSYANYQWIPDLSIYDEYPEIKTYITKGKFTDPSNRKVRIQNNKRNFFCYGLVKAMPLFVQKTLYDDGNYNQGNIGEYSDAYTGQTQEGLHKSKGLSETFMEAYNVLTNLSAMTTITDDNNNTFMTMTNDTTHEPMLLQEPEYIPQMYVDNTEYEKLHADRFILSGKELKMETEKQIIHYQTNMAVLLQLGKWFDYLRENDVYDNTRIILVADHGSAMRYSDRLELEDGTDAAIFYPLLMVKDFNSKEFITSEEFMTNGDVPTLAMQGLIDNPINPFTGNKISSEKKMDKQYVILSYIWDTSKNNGNTFLPGKWYTVQEDMRDKNNWKLVAEEAVLTGE